MEDYTLPAVNSKRWMDQEDLPGEIWRRAKMLPEEYVLASNYGRIKGEPCFEIHLYSATLLKCDTKAGIFRQFIDGRGYYKVQIKKKNYAVSRLVCSAFKDNPSRKRCVDHINGDRLDNRVENLRWVTHKENSRNPQTRFKQRGTKAIDQYDADGKFIGSYGSIRHAAEQTGVPRSTLGRELAKNGGAVTLCGFTFVVTHQNAAKNPANSAQQSV